MAGEGGFELERYAARRLAAVRNQIEGQRKDLQVASAALEDLRLKKEAKCSINDPPIQTFENRVATMVGSYIDELKTLEEGLRMAFIRQLIIKNAEIRKFQEIKGSTSNIKDKSRLSSSNEMKLAELSKQIEGQQKEFEAASVVLKDLTLRKETVQQEVKRCEVEHAMNDASLQTFEKRVAKIEDSISAVGSIIDEMKNMEEALREGFIKQMLKKNAEIRKLQEISDSTSKINDQSRLSSKNEMLADLSKKIEEQLKEFEAASAKLEDLKLQKEMMELEVNECEIELMTDDALIQTFEDRTAKIVKSSINEIKNLEEALRVEFLKQMMMKNIEKRKSRKIRGSSSEISQTRISSTNEYFPIPDDISGNDEGDNAAGLWSYITILTNVRVSLSKVIVMACLISSWINFLTDTSIAIYSGDEAVMFQFSMFSIFSSFITWVCSCWWLKFCCPKYTAQQQEAQSILSNFDPWYGRSYALAVLSTCVAIVQLGNACVRAWRLFHGQTFSGSWVLGIVISFIQMIISTITALECFEDVRLVCLSTQTVETLTKVEDLEPAGGGCHGQAHEAVISDEASHLVGALCEINYRRFEIYLNVLLILGFRKISFGLPIPVRYSGSLSMITEAAALVAEVQQHAAVARWRLTDLISSLGGASVAAGGREPGCSGAGDGSEGSHLGWAGGVRRRNF
uniref:Uncharacterized protein n=1 Tax=Kalanchoe fedtschenkoi TaxID=63787 RepID=A0A7N0VMQ8_KALFE